MLDTAEPFSEKATLSKINLDQRVGRAHTLDMPPTTSLPDGTLSSDLVIPFLPLPPRTPLEAAWLVVRAMYEELPEDVPSAE